MPPIHHIFFRQAGVITQTFEQAACRALFSAPAAGDSHRRLALHDLAIAMQSGRICFGEYCARAGRLGQSDFTEAQAVQSVIAHLRISDSMNSVLNEIVEQFNLWLFCEAGRSGMLQALRRLSLGRFFQEDHWVFSPELELGMQIPEIVPELVAISNASLAELLWVDDRSNAANKAIRAGLHAVAYVDPFRLRRNLVLRGLIRLEKHFQTTDHIAIFDHLGIDGLPGIAPELIIY